MSGPILPFMTTAQAAETLGVSLARVRQLVTAGSLSPLPLPGRDSLFWRPDVRAYAARNSTTVAARALPRPDAPLRLDTDVVVGWEPPFSLRGSSSHLDVRIYRGAYTVVVLSEPMVRHRLTNFIEEIADLVTRRYLHEEDPAEVVWVDVSAPHHYVGYGRPQTAVSRVRNAILSRLDANDVRGRWGGSAVGAVDRRRPRRPAGRGRAGRLRLGHLHPRPGRAVAAHGPAGADVVPSWTAARVYCGSTATKWSSSAVNTRSTAP